MAKDPTSQRRRGLHLLNDRLLALRNLVRVRNEEITMEATTEEDTSVSEEQQVDVNEDIVPDSDEVSSGNSDIDIEGDASLPDDGHEDTTYDDATAEQGEREPETSDPEDVPGVQEPALMQVPDFTDLDDLPVLTESISTGPLPTAIDSQPEVVEEPLEDPDSTTRSRADLENAAISILDLIDEQISYANLPHSTSADREALKRAIADYLENL